MVEIAPCLPLYTALQRNLAHDLIDKHKEAKWSHKLSFTQNEVRLSEVLVSEIYF
jgi:hypothetical protein